MKQDDTICSICNEPKSAHVATEKGQYTHPREARGEGEYVEVSPGHIQAGFMPGDEYEVGPRYEFRPFKRSDA